MKGIQKKAVAEVAAKKQGKEKVNRVLQVKELTESLRIALKEQFESGKKNSWG